MFTFRQRINPFRIFCPLFYSGFNFPTAIQRVDDIVRMILWHLGRIANADRNRLFRRRAAVSIQGALFWRLLRLKRNNCLFFEIKNIIHHHHHHPHCRVLLHLVKLLNLNQFHLMILFYAPSRCNPMRLMSLVWVDFMNEKVMCDSN